MALCLSVSARAVGLAIANLVWYLGCIEKVESQVLELQTKSRIQQDWSASAVSVVTDLRIWSLPKVPTIVVYRDGK